MARTDVMVLGAGIVGTSVALHLAKRGLSVALVERASVGEQTSYRHMWGFSWPLMVTQITENGVSFVINFFLGRLAHPDLALAAFGVVNGLSSLVAGLPMSCSSAAAKTAPRVVASSARQSGSAASASATSRVWVSTSPSA